MSFFINLNEVVSCIESGSRPKGGVDEEGDIPSLGAEHLDGFGGFNFKKIKRISDEFFNNMRSGHIQRNDILIVKDGATTGKVSYVDDSFPYKKSAVNEHVFILRVNQNKVVPTYIFHFLNNEDGKSQILKDFRGATVGGISRGFVNNIKIPLLPLSEQKRIAAILDKASEIKAKREQAIAKLDELAQSTFVEMFGDVNSKDCKTDHLGLGITLVGGGAFKSSDFLHEGIPLIRIGEVNRQDFDSDKLPCLPENFEKHYSRFIVKNGDLLMSLTGTTGKDDYGNVALINGLRGKYFLNQRVALIKPKEDVFITEYLMYLLKNKDIKNRLISRSRGVRQANISNGDITSLVVQFPPLAKQIEFKNAIKNISAYITSAKNGLRKNELLLTSLQHQIFTEELTS